MKSVLISIKPKSVEMIASRETTLYILKTRPKIETPFKCYIYCTIGGGWLTSVNGVVQKINGFELDLNVDSVINELNGCVIGEFVCDSILRNCEMANADIAEQQGKIKREKLLEYSNGKELYGWHISDLVIYDEPKEITEFRHECNGTCLDNKKGVVCEKVFRKEEKVWNGCDRLLPIKRPPQSWCYVEVK